MTDFQSCVQKGSLAASMVIHGVLVCKQTMNFAFFKMDFLFSPIRL
ncbi:hypothetical protein HanPSC8_Chr15g0668031 [Helianthus annuus]|nr:hypothetical protein HanPSC8_Chr15g0668031 [Helianthus annuus]